MGTFLAIVNVFPAIIKGIGFVQELFAGHPAKPENANQIKKEMVMKFVEVAMSGVLQGDRDKMVAAEPHISKIVDELVEVMKIVEA